MSNKIKFMADYYCTPLWWTEGRAGNIGLDELPLCSETKARLTTWAAVYDATLRRDDPGSSGFQTPEAMEAFVREGQVLCDLVRCELGRKFEVLYVSEDAYVGLRRS